MDEKKQPFYWSQSSYPEAKLNLIALVFVQMEAIGTKIRPLSAKNKGVV